MSPTIKQKKAFKKVVKSGNISQAMRESGYALSTSKKTEHLIKSKGWQELVEKYLIDEDLLKTHKQGLKATKIHTSHTESDKTIPDYLVRHKYLETGYKVKGKLPPIIQEGDSSFIKIEINQRILQIVKKAEEDMREELRKELND